MHQSTQEIVFFDLETGGGAPREHPIIQLAAVAVDESLQPLEAFEAKIAFDLKKAVRASLRKNHYSRGRWAQEAREPVEVAQDFAGFLRRHASVPMLDSAGVPYSVAQLVAHNASF